MLCSVGCGCVSTAGELDTETVPVWLRIAQLLEVSVAWPDVIILSDEIVTPAFVCVCMRAYARVYVCGCLCVWVEGVHLQCVSVCTCVCAMVLNLFILDLTLSFLSNVCVFCVCHGVKS